jgi:hypothetical protein
MHLTPEELLDLAEGTQALSSAPHLTTCERCRHQLAELRDVMAAIGGDADVPDPSPLFWEHFSTRVHEAVTADAVSARPWFGVGRWSWGLAAVMSAAVLAIAVSLTVRTPPTVTSVPAVAETPGNDVGSAPAVALDDPSFGLLGDLAGSLDWDSAAEAGRSVDVGAADTAAAELSQAERTELQRLLREAMAPTGV